MNQINGDRFNNSVTKLFSPIGEMQYFGTVKYEIWRQMYSSYISSTPTRTKASSSVDQDGYL